MRLFFSLLSILIIGCSDINTIESPQRSLVIAEDSLQAEGRWKKRGGSDNGIISEINFASIICLKSNMICIENLSLLITPKEGGNLQNPLLYINTFEYKITEWTDKVLKAETKPRAADIDIRISLTDEFVEKNFRETNARGAEISNPTISGYWTLE